MTRQRYWRYLTLARVVGRPNRFFRTLRVNLAYRVQPLKRILARAYRAIAARLKKAWASIVGVAHAHNPRRAARMLGIAYEMARWMPLDEYEQRLAACTTPEEVAALVSRDDVPMRMMSDEESQAARADAQAYMARKGMHW